MRVPAPGEYCISKRSSSRSFSLERHDYPGRTSPYTDPLDDNRGAEKRAQQLVQHSEGAE